MNTDDLELLTKLTVKHDVSVREVLSALDESGLRIVFVLDEEGRIIGAISDGDIRRALLKSGTLSDSASKVMNKNFVAVPDSFSGVEVSARLSGRIQVIPLVDEHGRPTSFIFQKDPAYIPAAEPVLGGNELAYVTDCVQSGWISSQGTYVRSFEKAFATYLGIDPDCVVSVSNGTVGLQLVLATLGITKGDEVIVPDLTFAATLNAVIHCGGTPVLVDVHPTNLTMDPDSVRAAITPKTKAIMPVHLYGQMCDLKAIEAIAVEYNLMVIEDAAEALGSRLSGQHAGTIGDAGAFSFFANKLITTGEGGMVTFKDATHADRARMLRDHGMDIGKRYWHLEPGFNFRLTNIQSAIGLAQMERIDELLQGKLRLAKSYRDQLQQYENILILPEQLSDSLHSFWNFVVMFRDGLGINASKKMIEFMHEHKIDVRRLFYPMHTMPPYKNIRCVGGCPNSVSAAQRGLAFPSSPNLTEETITEICRTFCRGVEMLDVERLTMQAASS